MNNKTGVLLTNLGTPDAPTKSAVKKYLKQFLSDKRVVEDQTIFWKLLLNLFILNIRPQKSAKLYKKIWYKFGKGSPLLDISISLTNKVAQSLGDNFIVSLGMRYGNPSIADALLQLTKCSKIIILPLYPQYSSTTTGSTFDEVTKVLRSWKVMPEIKFINNYFDNPLYIKALAQSISNKNDFLLMSYHGIPKKYADNGDVYPQHCEKTSYLLAKELKLKNYQYTMSYQSHFGKKEWLKNHTDEVLKKLPQKGIKNVQIICPGFAADCLETIHEIAIENKAYFLAAGGVNYQYIYALNASDNFLKLIINLIFTN